MAIGSGREGGFLRDDVVTVEDIASLIDRYAVSEGANPHSWPGLTFYRFSQPIPPHWDEVDSLSYCLVAQGVKKVRIGSEEHFYDPMRYLVLDYRSGFEVELIEAAPERPFLSCVLHIGPAVVNDVVSAMRLPTTVRMAERHGFEGNRTHVGLLDVHILGATYRFLNAINDEVDRAVLAPMYLREIVYRLLQTQAWKRLIECSRLNESRNPISAAIQYMKDEIKQPLSISEIADSVCMSESAFAHLFKQTIGTSPYQFLKQLRLKRARDLLLRDGHSVNQAASEVGYASVSHFTGEFKRYFGETPRAYIFRLRGVPTFNLHAN